MRNAIPIIPSPNLVRVSMTSEVGGGDRVVSLGTAVAVSLPLSPEANWFMLSRAASSVNACKSVEISKKIKFTCNVSPKRIVKIGMKEPQPKAIVRATTMRKVSNGDANLNWKKEFVFDRDIFNFVEYPFKFELENHLRSIS